MKEKKIMIIDKLFPELAKRIKDGKCPMCNEIIKRRDFRDVLSVNEFLISGMCQKCQDKVFGTNYDPEN